MKSNFRNKTFADNFKLQSKRWSRSTTKWKQTSWSRSLFENWTKTRL